MEPDPAHTGVGNAAVNSYQTRNFVELQTRGKRFLVDGYWWLRLEISPAFSDPMVVGIEGPDKQVTFRTWRVGLDEERVSAQSGWFWQRMRGASPTTFERVADDPLKFGDQATNELLALPVTLPLHPNSAGADGVGYRVSVRSGHAAIEYRWWCDQPREWQPLMSWFDRHWNALCRAANVDPSSGESLAGSVTEKRRT